jgi:hypothetical protein
LFNGYLHEMIKKVCERVVGGLPNVVNALTATGVCT